MEPGGLSPTDTFRPDYISKKTLDPIVTFARTLFEAGAVMHFNDPAPRCDQPLIASLHVVRKALINAQQQFAFSTRQMRRVPLGSKAENARHELLELVAPELLGRSQEILARQMCLDLNRRHRGFPRV